MPATTFPVVKRADCVDSSDEPGLRFLVGKMGALDEMVISVPSEQQRACALRRVLRAVSVSG